MDLCIVSSLAAISCICPVSTAGFELMDAVHCVAMPFTMQGCLGLCMSRRAAVGLLMVRELSGKDGAYDLYNVADTDGLWGDLER